MKVSIADQEFEDYVVFLNNRLVKTVVAADDEEGWVEILDPASMAPLDTSSNTDEPLEVELMTKKLYGTVELKKLPR